VNDALSELISHGENQTVEFKTSFQKEVIETVVAFANTKGGKIFIGISDSGDILGIKPKPESIQNWINQIKTNTQPSILVDIDDVEIEDKTIAVVDVKEYPVKPIAYKNRYYKRANNSNHLMDLTQISNMHLQSLQLSWDAYKAQDIKYDDLDFGKIDRFIAKVNSAKRFKLTDDRLMNLQKLNLLKEKEPTNAAKLLFSKEQTVYNIHIGRFKTPSMIIDDKMIKETLFEAVEQTMMYIISHIKVAFEFTGAISRTEIFEYPIKALRELVLNAIVHRDYTSPMDTQIKIFDKKITIFNPGKLYGDMTIEKLKTNNYQAQTRNKLIAEAFYLTNDIEKYGSGYIRVREAIADYPTMKFEYEEMGNGYLVTISYDIQKTSQKTTPPKTPPKTPLKTPLKTRDKIVALMKNNKNISIKDIASVLNLSRDTINEHIAKLKKDGALKRVGSARSGYWEILDE